MPSGSHSGSSGSHSSGGSSHSSSGSHSSHLSSSSSSSYSGGHYHHDTYYYGGYYGGGIQISKKSALNIVFIASIFFFIIFITACTSLISEQKAIMQKVQVDYDYYQAMIVSAESDSRYATLGTITDKFYNTEAEKWYLTYSFKDENGRTINGYTFSIYTSDQIKEYTIGDEILLAVNQYPINYNTDSIPMDYKNSKISDDGEYADAKSSIVVESFLIVIFIGLSGLMVFLMIKINKKKDTKEKIKPTTSSTPTTREVTYCEYCGSEMLNSYVKKCPNCGSTKRKTKTIENKK